MLENIDTIIFDAIRALYNGGQLGTGTFTPARLLDYTNSSAAIADAKTILPQVSMALSIIFGAIIVYLMIRRRELNGPAKPVDAPVVVEDVAIAPLPGALRSRWEQIAVHLESPREGDWKLAVMEADKLTDSALQQAGFGGATFGDRLTNIQPGTLVSLDGLWWAHRIRNRVAHEMDYFLRYTEARQALSYYEATLAEMQLI